MTESKVEDDRWAKLELAIELGDNNGAEPAVVPEASADSGQTTTETAVE